MDLTQEYLKSILHYDADTTVHRLIFPSVCCDQING
jgi:hypothetical protein